MALQDSISVDNGLTFEKFVEAIIKYCSYRSQPNELPNFLESLIQENINRALDLFN